MGLRDVESKLPPGFRFNPSDEELVCHYLYKKVNNERVSGGTMIEVDLHTREPWELPEVAKLSANEWYFFSFRDRKYATGSRTNRATRTGYWKATGKDRAVHEPLTRAIVGMRKTLVFYGGRAPNGIKTGWVMHEFRLETPNMPPKEDWVLCRVFNKRKGESVSSSEQVNYSTIGCSSSYMEMDQSPPPPVDDNQLQGGLMSNIGYDHQLAAFTSSAAAVSLSQYNNNNNNSPNTLLNMAVLRYNLLESPTQNIDANSGAAVGTNSRFRNEYGFLLDVALADQEMAEAAMVNLDDMRLYQDGKKDQFF